MAKRHIQLRPKADEDLEGIYRYSLQQFGKTKAIEYIDNLDKVFHTLARQPELALKCDHIKKGLLGFPTASHQIFFRVTQSHIVIVRILHKSMDHPQHL